MTTKPATMSGDKGKATSRGAGVRELLSSLRVQLIVLILVAVLPATGLVVYTMCKHREARGELVRQHLTTVASDVRTYLGLLTDGIREFLAGISHMPEVREDDSASCSALLASLVRENPEYASIIMVDSQGNLRASALPTSGQVSYADREWFKEAVETREFVSGGYVIGRTTNQPLATFAYPLLDAKGEVRSVLAVGLDLAWLNRYLAQVAVPPGALVMLVDPSGMILARTLEGDKWVGQRVAEAEVLQKVLGRQASGTVEAAGVDGVRRLYAYAPVSTTSGGSRQTSIGYALVGMPVALVYAEANRSFVIALVVLGVVLVVTLGVGVAGGELLVLRPIRVILEVTRRITAGDLSVRARVPRCSRELSELGWAFDEMAASLEGRIRERDRALDALHGSEERLRQLLSVSPTIIYSLRAEDFAATFVGSNVTTLTGYTPEECFQPGWWVEHVHPDDRARVTERASEILETGQLTHEYRFICKDGRVIWIHDQLRVLYDDGGKPVEIVGAWTDITERKQSEELTVQQLQTMTALYAGAQRLSESLSLGDVGRETCRACVEIFGCRLAWLGVLREDGRMVVSAQFPADRPHPIGASVRWDDVPESLTPVAQAVRTGFHQVVNDISRDPRIANWRAGGFSAGSFAALPLISGGVRLGTLNLYAERTGFFTPELLDALQALAHQAAVALANARLYEDAVRRLRRLQALRKIDMAITGSVDLRVTLRVILDEIAEQLQVDAAAVLLLDPRALELRFAAGRGFRTSTIESTCLRLGDDYAGRAAMERSTVSIEDLSRAEDLLRPQLVQAEGFRVYHAAPMVAKSSVLGVLEVFHRVPFRADREWLEMLETLAGQAAIALDNSRLFEELDRANLSLRQAYDATIEGWSRALDLRDKETEGHTQRVADLTVRLGRAMGMTDEELLHVRRGALLHDIGKMGVPDSILLKPGPLTEAEWQIMRKHPEYALAWLSPVKYLRPALEIPYSHHEKWDGTGYPSGLRGEQIPLAARIFAVVDVWDALTSDRPYRAAWPREKALEYIHEQSGTHFDPAVVDAFVQAVPSE